MNPTELEKVSQILPLSESTRRRNAQYEGPGPKMLTSLATAQSFIGEDAQPVKPTPKPRMNKLELRFYEVLKMKHAHGHITPQFRLRVSAWDAAVPVHYTADFLVSQRAGPVIRGVADAWMHALYECKDSRRPYHSDELNRPKMVREHNPWISEVILATWDGEKWSYRQIA